jgi:hypothetical protein
MNHQEESKPRTTWSDKAPPEREEPWPDPQPIQVELLPVAPLRPEMIIEPLRAWIVDEAYRLQVPLDFIGTPTICAISGVIGAGCTMRPKERDDWEVVANLWGAIIGRPGTKKSPAINKVVQPLRYLEELARKDYAASIKEYETELAVYKAQHKALIAEMDKAAQGSGGNVDKIKARLVSLESPKEPIRRRYLTNDPTIEKAGELMRDNPRGLILFRDELAGFLVSLDQADRPQDRSFHLQAWNGYGTFTVDRIGRGTVEVPQLCEAILGGIVPGKLNGYFRLKAGNIENDGLPQRFQLTVFPDEPRDVVKIVDDYPDKAAKERGFGIVETLACADFCTWGGLTNGANKSPHFHFAAEAQAFFNDWLLNLERRVLGKEDDIILEHLSKYRSLMPSLSLIFHLVEMAERQPSVSRGVPLHCAELAAQWCDYLETHARRIYGLATDTAAQSAKKLLEKIEDGFIQDGFQARDVYRHNWSFLDSKESTTAALEELVETGWLRAVPTLKQDGRGRPLSPSYRIHPKAREP